MDAPEIGAADRLKLAMGRGVPLIHDLVFEMRVSKSGTVKAASPVQRRALSEFEPFATSQLRDKVLIQKYSLQITTDGLAGSTSTSSSGTAPATMEMGMDAYERDNRLVWRKRHLLTVQAPDTSHQANALRFARPVEIPCHSNRFGNSLYKRF